MSSTLRITGLATGMDVDTMVKQIMRAETIKLDKLKQNRQLVQWKQDLYRELIGELNTFKSTYFDVLKPDTFMLSDKNFSSFDVSQIDSLTATASAGAIPGDYKITVTRLAEKARIGGTSVVNIAQAVDNFSFPAQISDDPVSGNNIIKLSFDGGNTYNSITIGKGEYHLSDLASKINSQLSTTKIGASDKFLNSRAVAVVDLEKQGIRFVAVQSFAGSQDLTITDPADSNKQYKITINKGTYNMDQLAAAINSGLSTVKDSNGKALSTRITAASSPDGKSIVYTKTSPTDGINTDKSFAAAFGIDIQNSNLVTSTNTLEYDRNIISGINDTLSVNVNGVAYTVKLDPSFAPMAYGKATGGKTNEEIIENLVLKLNDGLSKANNNTVDLTGTAANLKARLSLDRTKIEMVSDSNKTINVSGNASRYLGFSSSFSVNMSVDNKMSFLLGGTGLVGGNPAGRVDFTINDGSKDVEFRYDFNSSEDVNIGTEENPVIVKGVKNKRISDIINDISAKANVRLSYCQLTRKFTIESNTTGLSQAVTVKPTDDPVSAEFLSRVFGVHDANLVDGLQFEGVTDSGIDADVTIENPNGGCANIIKPTNTFTIDGVNYSLLKAGGGEKTLTITPNSQKTYDKIREFVDKYNDIIGKINEKLTEKKLYDYPPLTEDQKKEMNESDIKLWEEKAKQGLLSNDSILENMLSDMRSAFYTPVKASYSDTGSIGISLSGIGITTSSTTTTRGMLIIDEKKLKDAIANNGDRVADLFTKTSFEKPYYDPDLSNSDRSHRYQEEGIFQRINDILQDNLRTTRNVNGRKGILLENAGIKGDYSEYHNLLTDDLDDRDKAIDELIEKLAVKEEKYYLQFARLETAMQKMNDQTNWLAQQLSSMNGGN